MLDETEMGELRNCDERLYELNLNPETSLRTLIDRYVAAHPNDFYVEPADEAEAAKALLANAREIVNSWWSQHSGGQRRLADLDLAERLLRQAIDRASAAQADRIAALARSLLDQIPFMRA
jgi:hypothetical protein